MKMLRKIITGLLCLLVISCSNQQVTATATNTPFALATITIQPTNTFLPINIEEDAFRSGLSPEEIVSFFNELRSYVLTDDIEALAAKISYPISKCGRNKGDKIETKDEFIQRFNEIFTQEDKLRFLGAHLEDTTTSMYGVFIGGIWFSGICNGGDCSNMKVWVLGIGDYCAYRISAPTTVERATAEAAKPDYPEEDFVFGIYQLDSYQIVAGSVTPKEQIENLPKISIEKDKFTNNSNWSCLSPEYEFNKPFVSNGRALWYGIPAIGELIVICDGKPTDYFDILANDEIGYYLDGYYLKLKHK